MSTVKSKKLQVGTDATSSNNFTIYQPATPDGTLRIGVGNADSPTEVGRFDSNGYVATNAPAFRAYIGGGTNQSISQNTWTKVNLVSEDFDTNSCFDNITNYRFTPNVAGYYQVNGQIMHNMSGTTTVVLTAISKNGTRVCLTEWANWTFGSGNSVSCSDVIYMNGTTDYLELYGYSGSSSASFERDRGNTFLSASLVRAV